MAVRMPSGECCFGCFVLQLLFICHLHQCRPVSKPVDGGKSATPAGDTGFQLCSRQSGSVLGPLALLVLTSDCVCLRGECCFASSVDGAAFLFLLGQLHQVSLASCAWRFGWTIQFSVRGRGRRDYVSVKRRRTIGHHRMTFV